MSQVFDNLESNRNSTIVTNKEDEMSDLDKLRVELLAFKNFATEQFYWLKQSVGCPRQPGQIDIEVDANLLNEQIHYPKEEDKRKNSIIQSLI